MMYIPIILASILFVGLFIIYNRIVLPSSIDVLINEIENEELPNFVNGKTGFAKNGGIAISFEIMNSKNPNGETIVLVNAHGHSRLIWPIYFYKSFLDQGYTVIKYDNRGLGESDWMINWTKESPYSLEDMAKDAIAVLDKLKIEKAHFIGMSMGGMISQRIAISYPKRIQTLTSIMSSGYHGDPELVSVPKKFYFNIIGIMLLYGRKLKTISEKLKLDLSIHRLLKGKGNYKINDKAILQKAYYELTKRKGLNRKVADQHSTAIKISGSRYDDLSLIKCPTLVIHGTDDPLIKIAHAKKYAPLIENAKTLFIKGMGHDLPEKYIPDIQISIVENLKRKSS